MMLAFADFLLLYACPVCGIAIACVMYAAPVADLRFALRAGTLGKLNTVPWAWAAGNSFGWITYGYFHENLLVSASAMPGFLICLYLNMGAIKLQYYDLHMKRWEHDAATAKLRSCDTMSTGSVSTADETFETASCALINKSKVAEEYRNIAFDDFVPQEKYFLKVALAWMLICVYTGWFVDKETASLYIGFIVNVIMLVFYASPLQTAGSVVLTGDSSVIHRASLVASFSNAFFWTVYGVASNDVVVYAPNALGCLLGIAQMIFCILYPNADKRGASREEEQCLLASKSHLYTTIPAEVPIIVV